MPVEARAREIMGLEQPELAPRRLSMRVEYLWRAENFAPVVPFGGSIFAPMGASLDLGVLRESLIAVLRRHDVLHSRLALDGDMPVLAVDDVKPPELELVDVTRAGIAAYGEGAPASALSEFVDMPVDLLAQSGFRCRAFRDEDKNITLGIALHHYFGDGWSSQILRREITTSYALIAQGNAPELGEAPQYTDYALAQRQVLGKNLPAQLDYWRQRLATAPVGSLPYDHVRDTNQMGRIFFGIGEELAARLAAIAQSRRVSIFVIYLAALHLLLARWCGGNKAITAVNTADRIRPQFQNIVGYLIASVPVYTEIEDNWTLGELLSSVAKNFYDAYGHRDLSYDLYDQVFQPSGPFCTTLFNFIPLQEKLSGVRTWSAAPPPLDVVTAAPVQRVRVHREIYFCLVEMPRGMAGKIYFNLDFFSQKTFETLIARFTGILEKMAADPEGKVSAIL